MRSDPLAPFVHQITDLIELIPVVDGAVKTDMIAKEQAFAHDIKTLPAAMGFNTAYRSLLYNNAQNYDNFIKTLSPGR